MAFTDFTCRSGGSNLNGGALSTNGEAPTAAAYSSTNGNFNGTNTYTPTDGSTPASSVNVGDFASIYIDGATTAVYIAQVTAVAAGVNGAITLSTTRKAGTAPTSSATTRSIRVGGAWQGPNGANAFPIGLSTTGSLGTTTAPTRINFKNDQTYNVTAAMTHAAVDTVLQGYTTTFGDLGKATFDGGTTGASYTVFTANANTIDLYDLIFQNNGATGSADLVACNNRSLVVRCVFHDCRGNGFAFQFGSYHLAVECEAYNCNTSLTAGKGGFFNDSNSTFLRCIAHDNAGGSTNTAGFIMSNGGLYISCISESNAGLGFRSASASQGFTLIQCDAYNNGADGIQAAGASRFYIENCNLVKNGDWGINFSSGQKNSGMVVNCGFGTGTQANTSGQINNSQNMFVIGTVSYGSGVTPWVDPANGDFRINLPAAINAGRGNFTETQAGYAGTIGYPDIGAAQHLESGGGGGGGGNRIIGS